MMKYSLGIDAGSVNVKLALVSADGQVVHTDVEKVTTSQRAAINVLLARLDGTFPLNSIGSAGVAGPGRSPVLAEMGWGEYGSALSVAAGLLHAHPDARTILQIGGQSSLVIELADGLKSPWKVAANPLCAAGTGRFIEQQAYRLGISMGEFARLALQHKGPAPRIAARCSVFAKSDLIHLQQKGAPVEAMLYALCESVARMVVSLKKGPFAAPVYFVGGVAENKAVARALREAVSQRNGSDVDIAVPEYHLHVEAIGAALLARNLESRVALLPETNATTTYYRLPALEAPAGQVKSAIRRIDTNCAAYLGVDVGSTSTKAVLVDEDGKVLAKSYLMTSGRPVDAVKEVFRNLVADGADLAEVRGVGVTGSGRYLIGNYIGADLIKNEISAQTRAAAEIDPEADIIEVGGQDSKLVLKRKGVVIDYRMNKACAAGTGSFIDELAEMLDVPVKDGEFARLAFAAPHTIDLGSRCAAFMGQAVATSQRDGTPLHVITASLANSIARNYLTKVVANRRLGRKVILTGAVFYNEAVVAAFRQQLKDRELIVADQKEVSGAIGAALLAKEECHETSRFKGFRRVIDAEYTQSTFVCEGCENNCTVTRMQVAGEKSMFYGSRCDKYDSAIAHTRQETLFDEREKLLFAGCPEPSGKRLKVGVPRALLVHDYAPLLTGFLDSLGVDIILSHRTKAETMSRAIELSYADSCFPIKLLHGHIDSLRDTADYILYPCFVRLGEKEGEENQKYTCPLVQASPFIAGHVLDVRDRLLSPVFDLSQGTEEVVREFAEVAVRMGFSRAEGRRAILVGLEAQQKFETDRAALGVKVMSDLHASGKLGVVLFSRAYMSQDSGANLGIAEKLAQLGVVPVPIDFLPLDSINAREYSDRPYWSYEGKFIAAAHIVARDPQLFGLAVTNFGCGPNSFILGVIEDIMGGKPLGQVEIDEHAAEAGIVTRLEAFVDTIRSISKSEARPLLEQRIVRETGAFIRSGRTLVLPRMSPHVDVLAAAINAFGARAIVLPEPDETNILYSNEVTSGAECLPFRVTLGDFLRFCREHGGDLSGYEGLMAGAFGPCRLGKYAGEHNRAIREMGYDLPILASVSNNNYRDLNIDPGFPHFTLTSVTVVDVMLRLLWRTRPYEQTRGETDKLFNDLLARLVAKVSRKELPDGFLRRAREEFKALIDLNIPRKPLVGINGEVYLRANSFSNCDLVRACEDAGLEAVVSPIGEWMRYVAHRHVEDAVKARQPVKTLKRYITKYVIEHDEKALLEQCRDLLHNHEDSVGKILKRSGKYLSSRCGGEAVLSVGAGLEWLEKEQFAGVISVMPHGCMPGGIVAAMAEKFSAEHGKPWISVTYDGFAETSNLSKVREFAELIRFRGEGTEQI